MQRPADVSDREPAGRPRRSAAIWPGAVGASVLFGLLLVVLLTAGQPLAADLAVRSALNGWDRQAAALLTQLGAGPVLYPVLLGLSAWRLQRRAGRPLWWVVLPVLALAAGQVIESVLFAPLARPSPTYAPTPVSFSSGHAAAATLAWGLVAAAGGRRGRPIPILAAACGLVVGASRLMLGLHWATDVLAGVAFGLLLLLAALALDAAVPETSHPARRPVRPALRREGRWLWLVPAAVALVQIGMLLTTPARERLKDLLVYQGAGGVAGSGADVYGFRTALDMAFTYPPFAALLSEPLSRIPIGLGQALWTAATLAAVVAVARVALVPVTCRIGLPLTVAALLLASPLRSHLRFGQVGVFLVLVVALDLLRPDHGRGRGAGVGLAIAVKLTPAVSLPWLLVAVSRARLRATLLWAGGLSLLGMLLLWRSASGYLGGASTDPTRFGANDIPGNQSVRGLLLRSAMPEQLVTVTWLAVALVLVAVATYGAWRLERAGHRLAALGVLACLSIAVSPISWVHHLVWLVFPIAALVAAGRPVLVVCWYAVLLPGLPALGAAGAASGTGPAPLWWLVTELQGLTAVAGLLLLPALCLRRASRSDVPQQAPRPGRLVRPTSP